MQALYQRLKEIDSDTFEKLSYQILAGRYPGAAINRVDGSGGDRGLDLFSGTLSDGPAIWQCKHFSNGIKDSQRRKITVPEVIRPLINSIDECIGLKPLVQIDERKAASEIKLHKGAEPGSGLQENEIGPAIQVCIREGFHSTARTLWSLRGAA